MTTYSIIRFFADLSQDNEIIATGLSLEEAQEHCRRQDTRGVDEFGEVVWFDGFEFEDDE
jgi:hypothetical protein